MEKRTSLLGTTGGFAGMAALVAMLSGSPAQKTAAAAAKGDTKTEGTHAAPPLDVSPGRTLLAQHLQVPGSDLASKLPCKGCGTFRVLIATVPDPLRSRLDWAYDADLEAVRRAVEVQGYVLDRFWLPWDYDKNPPDPDTVPGAMLFRQAARSTGGQDLLLVYLVGETPTAGVSARALRRALDERAELLRGKWFRPLPGGPAGDTVRIVGPTFSGSVPSLLRTLSLWRDAPPPATPGAKPAAKGPPPVSVVTGSATLAQNTLFLNDPKQGLRFSATVHSSDEYMAAFDTLLGGRMGIEPQQVAMLEETSTSFGQLSSARDDRGVLRVAMPTHVSSVRDEAGDASDGRISAADVIRGGRGGLAMSLRGRPSDTEAPAQHSGLTPALTSLILDELIRTLQQHDIRAVGLQFTDVRDNLFVGEQIRARLHDVQLFAFESNALYLRAESNAALSGMVVFSTYPLFMESGEWAPGVRPLASQQLFPSDGAEGVYNATVLQLGGKRLADYTWTSGEGYAARLRPPVWLTVLGTHSLAPVNVVRLDGGYVRSISAKSGGGSVAAHAGAAPATGEMHRVGAIALATGLAAALVLMGAAVRGLLALARRRKDVLDALREVETARRGDQPVFLERVEDGVIAFVRRAGSRVSAALTAAAGAMGSRTPLAAGGGAADPTVQPADPGATPTVLAHAVALAPGARGELRRLGSVAWQTAAALRPSRFVTRSARLQEEQRKKVVYSGALLLHREIFGTIRLFAIGGAVLPLFAVLAAAGLPGQWIGMATQALLTVVGVTFLAAFAGGMVMALLVVANYSGEAHCYALRAGWWRRSEGWAWMGEIFTRLLIIGAGLLYVGATAWLVHDVWAMRAQPEFELFYLRALQGSSGVTPLVPLFVLGAGLAAWCTWHVKRIALLATPTAFEGAFVDPVVAHETEPAIDDGRRKQRCKLGERLGDVRSSLFLTMPRGHSLGFACTVLAAVMLIANRFQPTLEAAVLPAASGPVGPLGRVLHLAALATAALVVTLLLAPQARGWWLAFVAVAAVVVPRTGLAALYEQPVFAGLTSFDVLLRLGVLGVLAITLWGVYRFVMVWSALRRVLAYLEETPLLASFGRVPERISRLARAAVFGSTPQQAMDGALTTLWAQLATLYSDAGSREEIEKEMPAPQAEALAKLMERRPSWPCRAELWGDTSARSGVRQLFAAVQHVWARESDKGAAKRLRTGTSAHPEADADKAEAAVALLYEGYDEKMREWLRTAEDYLALQAVDYFQWVVESLYKLATFLFVILLLGTALLSSYPFQPQSLAKIVFLVVLVATVASLLVVMTQMNRDEILSRVARTEPGKITWDSSFVLNGMLIGIVPMLALVSSEFPGVRDLLFSWLGPLMKSVIGS
jgi:hypothetical protein